MRIYQLSECLQNIIMHWFLFTVSQLHSIPKGSNYYIRITEEFQRDTLPLLEPEYQYVEHSLEDEIIKVETPILISDSYVSDWYYTFVRDQILIKNTLESKVEPFRLLYISRNKVYTLNWRETLNSTNLDTRCIENEKHLLDKIEPAGFKCIYLEDYPLLEKIKLFQEAKVIVGPSGGGFALNFFAHAKSQIIEIRADQRDQYTHVCEVLKIPIRVYRNVSVLSNGSNNFHLNNSTELADLCKRYAQEQL